MHAARKASCPNCGGPIEWKLGASNACVCPWCRFSVVRRGQSLESLGKLAELVPSAPIMAVGDSGIVEGVGFRVGGRLQLDHGHGPWDEWFVELDNGRWGWLAKAQGRFYLTHPIDDARAPAWDRFQVGDAIALPSAGDVRWTVAEKGGSALLSAEGELPFAAVPMSSGRYADIEAPNGLFATIDYGDGSEPPTLYVGRQLPAGALTVEGRALGPPPEESTTAERLRCPSCGGPIDIRTPDRTERAACPSCQALLDYSDGALKFLEQLEQSRLEPMIPLGSEGTLRGESFTVIGYLERGTFADDELFTWREYLLYGAPGYRWLGEDGGHFTFFEPVSTADVEVRLTGVRHRGKNYRRFQSSRARVRAVLGEFYWRVARDDAALLADYVAPPNVLSSERTQSELNWSLGTYVPVDEVWKAFSLPGRPPRPVGVAPAQPNPVALGSLGAIALCLLGALFVLALTFEWANGGEPDLSIALNVPPAGSANPTPEQSVTLSEPFDLEGPTTLRVSLETDASNAWVGVAAALVDENTNQVREFQVLAEEWHGHSGGESWSEGSPDQTEYLGRVASGRYLLRFDTRWGREAGPVGAVPSAVVNVTGGKRSPLCCFGAGFLLLLPLLIALLRKAAFEAKRWSNSDLAASMES